MAPAVECLRVADVENLSTVCREVHDFTVVPKAANHRGWIWNALLFAAIAPASNIHSDSKHVRVHFFVKSAVLGFCLCPIKKSVVPNHGRSRVVGAMNVVMVQRNVGKVVWVSVHVDKTYGEGARGGDGNTGNRSQGRAE
jgi:hypothetical protein